MQLPLIDQLTTAIDRLAAVLKSPTTESCPIERVSGRVLAGPLTVDRDSPPLDVSAMDGYAMRFSDLPLGPLPITAVAAAGNAPVYLEKRSAVRIFTGGPVPAEADIVVKREDAIEESGKVSVLPTSQKLKLGQNIRRRGENGLAGQEILSRGTLLTAPRMSAVATFGPASLDVYSKVRVAILNTGDELVSPGRPAEAWQIRDSNGPVLESLLNSRSWLEVVQRSAVGDELDSIVASLNNALARADAVLLTGGVSMGDRDLVPEAIQRCGGKIVFHKLPIRPGKPILGAVGPTGQLICGLPGNPVSVAVTARRFAMLFLKKLAGMNLAEDADARLVGVANSDEKMLELVWYRLAKLRTDGLVELLDSRGSGDLVSLAMSDGFVEMDAGGCGPGPWLWRAW